MSKRQTSLPPLSGGRGTRRDEVNRSPGIPARQPFTHTKHVTTATQASRLRQLTSVALHRHRAGARWSQGGRNTINTLSAGRGTRRAEVNRSPGIPARPPFAHTKHVATAAQASRQRQLTGAALHRHRAGARWSQRDATQSTPFREGEAPAEPKSTVARAFLLGPIPQKTLGISRVTRSSCPGSSPHYEVWP
jgi:hypothetical protein